MWTGDQRRDGEAGAKCQQMQPKVAARYSIARGVKLKEGLSPRGKECPTKSSFILVGNGRLQSMEK